MKKSNLIILIIACGLGYFAYDRYVVQPKELNFVSERMLTQIAIKEQWFDALEGLRSLPNGLASLSHEIESAFKDGDTAYAKGKIIYMSETTEVCKVVDFKFRYGSLNDYEIFSQSNCVH